jgi:probable F420-dependent oxidoreductase
MKLGFNLPQVGDAASRDGIIAVAKRAEELGYDSVWVTDRVLYPLEPQSGYGGSPNAPIPTPYQIVLDPLEALTFASAFTSRVSLGTSVLIFGYYNPVLLARRLTTLDVLSNGRLKVGFGQGWSKDEFDATNGSMHQRAEVADEFVEVLHTIWTQDTVEHHGKHFQVPKSIIKPKPVQKPHPPIYMAAFSPGAMKRTATWAQGWNPVGVPLSQVPAMLQMIQGMAKEAGRNPDEIKVLYRANINLLPQPLGDDRWAFSGSLDQIRSDIQLAESVGIDELFFDPTFSEAGTTVQGFLDLMQTIKS